MTGHLNDATAHALAEGLLEGDDRVVAEAHLQDCLACRSRLRAVERTLAALHELPREARPSRDLWPDIRARMAAGRPGGARTPEGPRTTFRWLPASAGRLLAAGIALAMLSGGAVWLALRGGPVAIPDAPGVLAPSGSAALATTSERYEEAVTELEAILDAGRDLLDPVTVSTLEESLAAIDRAILEARAALEADPSSDLLNRLLGSHRQARLRVLRQAASVIQVQS